MTKKTYDDLSDPDKQKLMAYYLWQNNAEIRHTWIVIMVCVNIILMFYFINDILYLAILTCNLFYILYIFISKIMNLRKERKLIFGIDTSTNEYFFGIKQKECEVSLKEMYQDFKRIQGGENDKQINRRKFDRSKKLHQSDR